jgi:Domain of unknown function (DUF6265)
MNSVKLALAIALLAPATALAAPAATLADLAWLQGSWEGEGIAGAPALEAYAPAAGGQMVGHFRQMKADGTVMFYEIITIVEQDGSLAYRLKHFNPDLTGWEEKNEVEAFALTEKSPDRFDFSGLAYERTGPDTMTATVEIEEKGKRDTLVFRFRRK